MTGLILLFVIGYLSYVGLGYFSNILDRHSNAYDLIVPGIFFFGACFVWLSSILALKTALDIKRITLLEWESFTDSLTGVYNRRYMEKRLREEVAKARRYGVELTILLLDIDHFKPINDEHGHQAGDQVLIDLGAIVTEELRDTDILTRYGGEEFLVIGPNTSLTDATIVAKRLCQRIESHSFRLHTREAPVLEIRVTVSIGVAHYGGTINSEESLIRAADNNLYRAKDKGRNQVVADAPGD